MDHFNRQNNEKVCNSYRYLLYTISFKTAAQTQAEQEVLNLSHKIFQWETSNELVSLENIFHPKFLVVNSSGESQTKAQYITRLRSGTFVHNNIEVQQDTSIVENNTATVIGKGIFTVTASGNKMSFPLSYIEVFTRENETHSWKVLAMKASSLQH